MEEKIGMNIGLIKENKYKCPFCDYRFNDLSELEGHLKENHFLSMKDYYEMMTFKDHKDAVCYKCGNIRPPLTYVNPGGYYLPCWDCVSNKYERTQFITTIQSAIKDYFGKVIKDRYLQMFLVNDLYFQWTLSHSYEEFRDVLKNLQKYGRNKIWFLDWVPGFPKTICLDNLEGIEVKLIDKWYEVESGDGKIRINSWIVNYPELIPFDQRHHHRYNILNLSSDVRNTKRLRLKDDEDRCIKFFNNGEIVKSVFSITDLNGNPLTEQLSEQDMTVTKLVLMRNKTFMKVVWSVIEELTKNVGILSDSAFLKNTVTINPGKSQLKVNLSWTPEGKRDNFINISIL